MKEAISSEMHYGEGSEKITSELGKLHAIFAKELTPELSAQYLASLAAKLGGIDQDWETFVKKGEELHKFVGEHVYGPLIVGYIQWVKDNCKSLEHQGAVYFALRDAAPLEIAANILWQNEPLYPVGIYANRPILGLEDEIAPKEESKEIQLGLEYLKSKGVHKNGNIVWVDSGAWGTVVKLMKQTILTDTQFFPLFWYSHNPHIPGYLNTLAGEAGLSDKTLEVINDSLECMFPQIWQRPTQIVDNGSGPEVMLTQSTDLAISWGKAALEGVAKAASSYQQGITKEAEVAHLKMLAELHTSAKLTGEWTGVLSQNTPTWSHGASFIAEWPEALLP